MADVDFKFGSLIRTGPKLVNGGKWNADLAEWVRNAKTNADLTIYIRVHFAKIDPAHSTGEYGDADDRPGHPSKRKIQKWQAGEFERFTNNLVMGAQKFWNGVFWLKTPKSYNGLNYPDHRATHRCNLYCRFDLKLAATEADAHYTIAVVRAQNGETFRSHSRLYDQNDIKSERRIPRSTTKFWAHFHEVGHLLGLGHVGTGGHTNVHNDRSLSAYGVTQEEMRDVMGKGSVRHAWHATPWQQAAEAFTGVKASEWKPHQTHILPERI